MRIRVKEDQIVEWIGYNQICTNARFVFDVPIKLETQDVLQLMNGCWYLISQGIKIPMQGRWDR